MPDAACAKCRLVEQIDLAAERASQAGVALIDIVGVLQAAQTRWEQRYLLIQQQGM
jgi:hypothetical protein